MLLLFSAGGVGASIPATSARRVTCAAGRCAAIRYNDSSMRLWVLTRLALCLLGCALLGACGDSAPAEVSTPTAPVAAIPAAVSPPGRTLLDWPEFGLDPQRSGVSEAGTGISGDSVGR